MVAPPSQPQTETRRSPTIATIVVFKQKYAHEMRMNGKVPDEDLPSEDP
jgi:hypothetical protein